ncbi:MAG: hypothetical protein H0T53_04945 [Herpetosiphonaceae bacterium]|nr:hypothetical protein [Herpetosiphonaceae bacterium]
MKPKQTATRAIAHTQRITVPDYDEIPQPSSLDTHRPTNILALQRTVGNQAVGQLLAQTAHHQGVATKKHTTDSALPATSGDSNVVQRMLKIGLFPVKSLENVKEDVKSECLALLKGNRFGVETLEQAMESEHSFWFKGRLGSFELIITEAKETKVDEEPKLASTISSTSQVSSPRYVAGDEIVFVDSANGSQHLEISGLIGCVGIIVEKKTTTSIQAAATHLLDEHYNDSAIDQSGYLIIDELLNKVGVSAGEIGSGTTTMTLVTSSEVHFYKMHKLVAKYIRDKGGEPETHSPFTSRVFYSLVCNK